MFFCNKREAKSLPLEDTRAPPRGVGGAHNHIHDGLDGLGDGLLGVRVLPPVCSCEVAPVGVVSGNDAQAWLLGAGGLGLE